MKKVYSMLMMLATIVAALSLTACSSSSSDDEVNDAPNPQIKYNIIGTWKCVSYIEGTTETSNDKGFYMQFNSDKTFKDISINDYESYGTWEEKDNTITLTYKEKVTTENGKIKRTTLNNTTVFFIDNVTNNSLILKINSVDNISMGDKVYKIKFKNVQDNTIYNDFFLSLSKHIIKVTHGSITDDYSYDTQGRLVQIQRKLNSEDKSRIFRSYTYDNNTIIETIYESKFSYQIQYTLEDGRICKLYDGDTKNTYSYEYKDDYLITETALKRQISYIWNDENLVSVDYKNENTKETYEYTNYICPPGFFPFGHYVTICYNWGMSGYLGKTMRNLPSKHTEDKDVETYDWTFENGLPVKMIRKYGKSSSTYTFVWN